MAISCGRYWATMLRTQLKYLAQARREFALRGADHPARHVGQPRPGRIQDAETGALRAGIDAEHPHRRELKRASVLPARHAN